MTSARTLRVPRPARSHEQPDLNRRWRRWLEHLLARLTPAIQRSAAACNADRYRKHFPALGHAIFLLYHGLSRSPSLHQSTPPRPASPPPPVCYTSCTSVATSPLPARPRPLRCPR